MLDNVYPYRTLSNLSIEENLIQPYLAKPYPTLSGQTLPNLNWPNLIQPHQNIQKEGGIQPHSKGMLDRFNEFG